MDDRAMEPLPDGKEENVSGTRPDLDEFGLDLGNAGLDLQAISEVRVPWNVFVMCLCVCLCGSWQLLITGLSCYPDLAINTDTLYLSVCVDIL